MPNPVSLLLNLAIAFGIGLLIGAERERRKGGGPARSPAGIRTFSAASLAGATSVMVGSALVLAATVVGVAALIAVAYFKSRSDDPGLTTEIALILTALLGGLSMQQPALAAGLAVALAALLAARIPLQHFVRSVLTEGEVRDALIFAGATLVILPLLPNQALGPYGALNPRSIWIIVILVMAISAAGYVLVRVLGPRFGLPIAGLASGFVSSTATIGAMATRVQKSPDTIDAAVAGAALSTVATIVQLSLVLAATSMVTSPHSLHSADMRGHCRDRLWRSLHAEGPARERTARPCAGTGVQPPGRAGVRPDTVHNARCVSRAAGLVRRDGNHCSGCRCRVCRHPFRGDCRCFDGCIGKDGSVRRHVSYSCRTFNQYNQQNYFCLE